MTRQRYSKTEALNRILRLMEGSPIPNDYPGTVTGDILSENEALSDIAEVLANSLPNHNMYPVGMKYGHMFMHNATGTIAVAAQDAYYAISGGFKTGLLSNGITFTEGMHLKPALSGRFLINYSVSAQSTSANQEVESAILINTIAQTGSSAHVENTGASKPHVLGGTLVADITANSIVGIGLANHSGANNMMASHANLSMLLIAPYGG